MHSFRGTSRQTTVSGHHQQRLSRGLKIPCKGPFSRQLFFARAEIQDDTNTESLTDRQGDNTTKRQATKTHVKGLKVICIQMRIQCLFCI